MIKHYDFGRVLDSVGIIYLCTTYFDYVRLYRLSLEYSGALDASQAYSPSSNSPYKGFKAYSGSKTRLLTITLY